MTTSLRVLSAPILLGCAALLGSCSGDGCTHNQNSLPLAGFYDYVTREPMTITGLAIGGVGAPNDSLLLDAATSSHQVYLPFRGAQSHTSFRFASGIVTDELTFEYESFPYFDGEECGAMWRYRIEEFSFRGTIIDSVAITDPLITNIERERIMIFITAAPADEPEE